MERRDFLRNTGLASLGLGFSLNGFAADFFNTSPFTLLDCNTINDRVLVIVRFAGANDGLNMCVPINYYDQYANHRPSLKLNNVGQTNGIIALDNTVADNKKVGLHPVMTGIKSLYDAGKVQLINNVGYPNSNGSHFASENIMWAGKDGAFSGVLDEGMIGNYINTIYPNLSGNPTGLMSDPLCLHLGSYNPIKSFSHDHGSRSVEYNATFLQTSFNAILGKAAPSTANSDHSQKIDYLKGIEQNMDVYYNRVMACFNSGVNSSTIYPDTSLAKQLKTIARLLKGGSKTKIFQCTIEGFDTHANQIQSGSSHIGQHANLLTNVSNAITAFQSDISVMGFSNKVLTTTFSEFGRKVKENGSLGTDHGNFAPMWVIGDAVNAGITGVNPNLNNVYGGSNGTYYTSELQFDYRQVYVKFFQDWLGSSGNVINSIGLSAFATNNPISIIKPDQNANPTCLTDAILANCTDYSSSTTRILILKSSDAAWEYYGVAGIEKYLVGVEKNPTGTGANTNPFDIEFTYTSLDCAPNNIGCYKKTFNQEGIFASNDFFNMKIISNTSLNGWVNLRWFIPTNMEPNLINAATDFKTSMNSNYISPVIWLKKTNSQMKLIEHLRDDALGLFYATEKMTLEFSSSESGFAYHQFNRVENIHGTGVAGIIRVSNLLETDNAYTIPAPIPDKKGSIQFNPTSKTFEGYDGINWEPLH
jgi:uncharacterized protein (DUF1501 family)